MAATTEEMPTPSETPSEVPREQSLGKFVHKMTDKEWKEAHARRNAANEQRILDQTYRELGPPENPQIALRLPTLNGERKYVYASLDESRKIGDEERAKLLRMRVENAFAKEDWRLLGKYTTTPRKPAVVLSPDFLDPPNEKSE